MSYVISNNYLGFSIDGEFSSLAEAKKHLIKAINNDIKSCLASDWWIEERLTI